jgi:hypothetical protein
LDLYPQPVKIKYHPFRQGKQIVEIDSISAWEAFIRYLDMTRPRSLHWSFDYPAPNNAYIVRNRSGEILAQYNVPGTPFKKEDFKKPYAWRITQDFSEHKPENTSFCYNVNGNVSSLYVFRVYAPSGRQGLLDRNGNLVMEAEYDDIRIVDPLIIFKIHGKSGLMDQHFKVILPAEYGEIVYRQGLFMATLNGKWGLISADGKPIGEFKYDGEPKWQPYGLFSIRYNSRVGLIDSMSKVVCTPAYAQDIYFRDGMAAVYRDGYWGYIDSTGKEVIPCIYNMAMPFSEGLGAVSSNRRYGFVNRKGEVVIPFTFTRAEPFERGKALVQLPLAEGGRLFYINRAGLEIKH